jgi:hypothetical protein
MQSLSTNTDHPALNFMICRAFWSGAAANAVVVEADAFKETDVIYRAISSRGHHNDMLRTAELVIFAIRNKN